MSNPQGDAYKKAGLTGALTEASYPGSFTGMDLPKRTPEQMAEAQEKIAKEEKEYAAEKKADGGRRRRRGKKTAKASKKTAGRRRRASRRTMSRR